MLSPEFLDLIEFNEVVNLYTRLNIEITSDIIRRILKMNKISSATRYQLKKILQTGGAEVFNEVLEKTSLLTAEMKKELKNVFEEMAKEDIEGYKELYEYKGKPFKLSTEQYKILNQGLKETEHTLKNFTKSIAFESQQDYINAVDEVYNQIITGTFDYNTAMNRAAQKLADKGVTLKDKLGRNIQLEVAIRRNIMTSIHRTASTINRDIEDYLGCDGYEVSAHMGARPTHAEAQGKQYAKEHKTKISKKYPLWRDVEDLWQEYNCHHTYFGIILGVTEPQYNKKELNEFKNAKVTLNGKKVPYYEATQKQRAKENKIRHQKRKIQTLEKSGLDTTTEKSKLRQMQKDLTSFCKETGLEKDYSRMKIAKTNNSNLIKTIKNVKISEISKDLDKLKVKYNPINKLKKKLSSNEIIQKIAGGDKTKGSCSSAAFAYIANRNGLDVLDFRGGESQSFFSKNGNIQKISQIKGIKSTIEENYNDIKGVMNLLNKIEKGKEYYLSTGEHAAIIKEKDGKIQYLELQNPNEKDNGFKPLTVNTLKSRFKCKQTHSTYGIKYKDKSILMEVDSFKNNKEFEEFMGYINTQKNRQMKGKEGSVK